ncbi:hypothetical protein LTR17_022094 [Elasticomyces elasticus]|nr:hypothetical protein LTR17_022094 [Elasticomyces elasticus]
MATPFFDKLATETRLQIYAEVLRSDGPLEHKYSIIANKHTRGLNGRTRNVRTAILVVNRQAYIEALPVFYECNTILLRHRDVCTAEPGGFVNFPNCNQGLLRNVFVKDDGTAPRHCPCDHQVTELLRIVGTIAATSCPKFKNITFPMPHLSYIADTPGGGAYHEIGLSDHLRLEGLAVHCPKVGRFEVAFPGSPHSITLQDDAMLQFWAAHAQIPKQDIALLIRECHDGSVKDAVQRLFQAIRDGWSSSLMGALDPVALLRFYEIKWLDMGVHNENFTERVTDALMPEAQAVLQSARRTAVAPEAGQEGMGMAFRKPRKGEEVIHESC